jgi:hypothetical protein
MTARLEDSLRSLTTTTLRVQPVEPPKRTPEEMGQFFAGALVLIPAIVALWSWFLMLAMGTLNDLFPAVPTVGFWQAVTLVLGLHTVAVIARRPVWKWARR